MFQYPQVSSEKSETPCYLRIKNFTEKNVNIIWVNFGGKYVSYTVIQKSEFVDIDTYKTHPWIAVDNDTHDGLLLNNEIVHFPKTFREYYSELYPNSKYLDCIRETRVLVRITLPVRTLKMTVSIFLKNHLKDPARIDELDLPQSLKQTLKHLMEQNITMLHIPKVPNPLFP